MISAIIALLFILLFFYIVFLATVLRGLYSLKRISSSGRKKVSVLIAARNEENNIGRCLQSLSRQSYPMEQYEVIVIDDGSSDKTAEVVSSFQKTLNNLHVISLPQYNWASSGRKPQALAEGIKIARGEIILTTDADCTVPYRWIELMEAHFKNDVVFITGPVIEKVETNIFSQMEYLEFLGIVSTGAGLIGSGYPIICNGANLGYRKSAYQRVKGYSNYSLSNDDETLMHQILNNGIGKVDFVASVDAVVLTQSSNSLSSFFRQRMRWANKRGHYENNNILAVLVMLYLFFLFFCLSAVFAFFTSAVLIPISAALFLKIAIDYLVLRKGALLFGQRVSLFFFLIAELLHAPYIVVVAALGQVQSMKWKGRVIRQ